jgi:hypothetical protein
VNNHIWGRIGRLPWEVREVAKEMAYACGKLGLMLAAVKNRDLVSHGVQPSDRVWPSQTRASKDQNTHNLLFCSLAHAAEFGGPPNI